MKPIVSVENVERSFGKGNKKVQVLNGINLTIDPYSVTALRGRSGSGKTTLLNLIGGLDKPTNGEIYFQEAPISEYSDTQSAEFRRKNLGIIFQSFGLVPLMTVEENVEFGLRIAGVPRKEWSERIKETIALVGLTKRAKHRQYELSGGEQQRVAIARALAPRPKLILADEPTAELDSKMAFHIIRVFQELTKNKETTIMMTTHDPGILEILDHVYTLEDGKIESAKQEQETK
ncbi:ABC transporter ATP-binding protein [Evansella cellulosilytica]|uniref:ABC transporter related protein n=1 Tax=Evansella cellulosilytica (strain ATCC 21833 / DSM 2522 / FERM P-1141 / JCM 9156 / N-4) TaxID=649639 RepID=E6TXI7_EVAC2|nr:ABC transporter ATP-binding protein [Evansella cellulosilytica]ADU28801.1 ABC transporter related protein [Evansella cellulosilytica DSM 2522]